MTLYLMQHGESVPEEIDRQRPLSDEGRRSVTHIAQAARDNGVHVQRVYHSGKQRARQTAEILAAHLDAQVFIREGLAPNDAVIPIAQWLEQVSGTGLEALAVVGHLPSLDRLVSLLVTGNENRSVVAFRNAGLVRLDPRVGGRGYRVTWILWPEHAQALAQRTIHLSVH